MLISATYPLNYMLVWPLVKVFLASKKLFDLLSKGRKYLLPVAYYSKASLPEDVSFRVLVYSHDVLGTGAACHMLA